ncbi:uncharacterized protein [Choristoneura fumiferana]|uniref:uncharacterized protein n=1 Tax=Choristoneura fumiferana TaxID=7141 RepID=UPI003D15BCA4
MTRWGHLCIMLGLAWTVHGVSNPTFISTEVTSTNASHLIVSSIGTPHYVMIPKRKGVLTILSNDTLLRSKKPKSSKVVTSLKYEEYDDDGNLLNSVFMYNLQDVANFFKEYLDTIVCIQQCNQ